MDSPPSQRVRAGAAQVYKTLLNTLTLYSYLLQRRRLL